ncbi:MAG: HNH endonuclease signature motif containing protein [Mycobacteriales bacterium]
MLPQVLGLTAGETRRLVKQALVRLDAQAGEDRRAQQHRERRAFVSPKPDGRAFVGVHGSAEAATGFWDALTLLATLTFGADDPRTLDQQRADLALSLPGFALSSRRGHGPSLRNFLGLPDVEHGEGACALARRNDLTPSQQRRTQAVVLVPVQTGLGLADEPAELVGYGPVSAPHARELLAAAELRQACVDLTTGRLVALSDEVVRPPRWAGRYWPSAHPALDPVDLDGYEHRIGDGGGDDDAGDVSRDGSAGGGLPGGGPCGGRPPGPGSEGRAQHGNRPPPGLTAPRPPITLHDALLRMVDTPLPAEARQEDRHDPTPGLADLVRFRDPRCIGPGCSAPSRRCDLEHWDPWPTGTTSAANLGPASRRCHNAKTFGGWSYTPHPDGRVTWTTTWGRTFVKRSSTRPVDLRALRPRQVEAPPHQRPSG